MQIETFLRSYKRGRAELVRDAYLRLTPRNGKYTPAPLAERQRFEEQLLSMRANSVRQLLEELPAERPLTSAP